MHIDNSIDIPKEIKESFKETIKKGRKKDNPICYDLEAPKYLRELERKSKQKTIGRIKNK